MKTILKILGAALSVLTLTGLVVVGLLFWAPEKAVTWAVRRFGPSQYEITWRTLKIDWRLRLPLKLESQIQFENFGVKGLNNESDFKIQYFESAFGFQFRTRQFDLKKLILKAPETLVIDLTNQKSISDNETEGTLTQPVDQLQKIKSILATLHEKIQLGLIDIEIPKIEIRSPDSSWIGDVIVRSTQQSSVVNFSTNWGQSSSAQIQVRTKGTLELGNQETLPLLLTMHLDLQMQKMKIQQSIELISRKDLDELKSRGSILIESGQSKIRVLPDFNLSLTAQGLKARLNASAQGLPRPIAKADNLDVIFEIPIGSNERSHFDLSLPLEILGPKPRALKELKAICACPNPLLFTIRSKGDFNFNELLTAEPNSSDLLQADLMVQGPTSRLFNLDLRSRLHLEKKNGKYRIKPELNSSLIVPSFRNLQPLLQVFGIFVPAPFDVLDGPVQLNAQGYLTADENVYSFPIGLKTDLKSQKQVARISIESDVQVLSNLKEIFFDVKTKVDQLRLELPPLNPLGGRPRITPDTRILREPEEEKKSGGMKVRFHFQVASSQPGSIQLMADYFRPYIPVTLRLGVQSDRERRGELRLEPFDIVYLKRKVRVEKMKLDLDQIEEDVIPVEGRLKIKQTNYTIYIEIEGHALKPQITLRSEPDLSQNEIISVLLYDRTTDQLVSGDAETAGGVQAALADRAIGLFGLWAFASTPIRSFSYNPVTKVYTATLALGDGLTAGIGTTWESAAQLELRKRLSRKWILTASWSTLNPEEGQQTRLVLQWENRF